MSNQTPPAGEDVLPEVDEVLARALLDQGAQGVRALGLVRDAHRILSGAGGLERPGEIVEACVRSAADALLKLPGAPKDAAGLQSAAKGLLHEVDALPAPAAQSAGAAEADGAQWERMRGAAEVLRGEIAIPGGHHRRKARGIAERLMGLRLGAAQDKALGAWGDLYSKTSGTLHGAGAEEDRPARLYAALLVAARELLVPLPGRAARVLELAALTGPGGKEAAELAGWADPRAEAYFFRSGPAATWLEVLDDHAPHLLLADKETGIWPAAPFLEHLAAHAPHAARPWLAGRAVELAAAGPGVLDALLRLALDGALTPADVRLLLPEVTAPPRPGAPAGQAGWSRRLAARWARTLPVAERNGDWLVVAEGLLKDAVDAEHAGRAALLAVAAPPHTAGEAVAADAGPDGASGRPGGEREAAAAGAYPDDTAGRAREEALIDLQLEEEIVRLTAERLPGHDVAVLLREMVTTVHRGAAGGEPFGWDRAARNATAGLLRRDLDATPGAARHVVFDVDLDEVRLGDPVFAFLGPQLARAVLDLAAADAAAGVRLGERLRGWPRIAAEDPRLHDRLLAAHLAAHPPTPGTGGAAEAADVGEWWDRAVEVTVRLLAGRPPAEGARLAALVLRDCPAERAAALQQRARAALGPAPTAQEADRLLPAGADEVDGRVEPLASWLRVWDWSPVLPAPLLTAFAALLAALRRLQPAGPSDPRATVRPEPVRQSVALQTEDLLQLAATAGPLAAAAALAAAQDAGADGYAIELHRLVQAAPDAWTADVPQLLAALARPDLGAFYLAAAATAAGTPGAFPAGPAAAALAALTLRRALPAAAGHQPSTAVLFADQALFDLLGVVWRTGADLGAELPAVLDHLRDLAEPLTRPAALATAAGPPHDTPCAPEPDSAQAGPADAVLRGEEAGPEAGPGGELMGSHPAVRALGSLIEYAAHQAHAGSEMPADVLDLVAAVLAARVGDEAVATAIGVHLPALHRRAPAFTASHPELYALDPGRHSPATAWLRWGGHDPLLLGALDRGRLLAAVREDLPGALAQVARALTGGHPGLLGDPAAAWAELAAGPGGAAAASRLLAALALHAPHRPYTRGVTAPAPRAAVAPAAVDAVLVWWTAALDAGLPPGALAGAGNFADLAVPDEVWLPLARASAAHTPAQSEAGDVAERAAGHPRSPDALLLAARLLTRPAPDPWYDAQVRRHARALLRAADVGPAAERPAQAEQLRLALVEAGEVDVAQPAPEELPGRGPGTGSGAIGG
ncbi:hypothetical protein [Streptomyces sp. NPDC055912]|uniref:hypothetical protein n=1 Tax=Streptomyces sp. NPDC055912 TaxID=3345660 RepID=UPI0035E227B1